MSKWDTSDDPLGAVEVAVGALERGDWRAVLRPTELGGRVAAGSRDLVRSAVALQLAAWSMQLQAQGRVQDAWDRLADAAAVLPPPLYRRDGSTGTAHALLTRKAVPADATARWRLARLIWREQFELEDVRRRFAVGRAKARDELVEACIHHLFWVEFDHCAFYRVPPRDTGWDDGTTVDRLRSVLCLRGSRLRQFADPTAGRLSQAVWQDVGGYRGLCALAFDRLGEQPAPAPWCKVEGTSEVPVRRGRLRAWQHAQWRRDDLGSRPATLAQAL